MTSDGKVSCWGHNGYQQLGKTGGNSLVPAQVMLGAQPLTGQVAISAGYVHTCSLAASGSVYCWGYNVDGELGNGGSPATSATPVQVTGLTDAVAIASGVSHTCALRGNGSIRCWGWNQYKQLGDGTTATRMTPVDVTLAGVSSVVAISAYYTHTCAFNGAGAAWCWGDNTYGQLGTSVTTSTFNTLSVTNVSGLATGYDYSCARLVDGTLNCWGWDDVGQLGRGTISASITAPGAVPGISDAVDLAAGFNVACALRSSGQMKCWGNNVSSPADSSALYAANPPPNIDVGDQHACALRSDGTVDCWGNNANKQLGNPTFMPTSSNTFVRAELRQATKVVTGSAHSCALRANGTVVCWGKNDYGQLGNGLVGGADVNRPTLIPNLAHVRSIAAGDNFTCAITTDSGYPQCWGSNGSGSLGVDPATTAARGTVGSATAAGSNVNWIDIAAGYDHACALASNGTAYCWGGNAYGQLGRGTFSWSYTSTVDSVHSLSGATALTAGSGVTCALVKDSVYCWGNNGDGQLGTCCADESLPQLVPGLSGVIAIEAGDFHVCALKTDGSVSCWGYNTSGQLGDGTQVSSSFPVAVSGLTGAVAVSGGASNTCALLADGTAKCWGDNAVGTLGNPVANLSTTPVVVSSFARACSAEGFACTTNASCCGGDCSQGKCQPPGCGPNFGNGEPCNDNNACTAGDTCNGTGTCIPGAPVNPDDGNPCTTDSCNTATGVQHTNVAAGSSCSDGNVCNGSETCNGSGQCAPGAPLALTDNNACTVDTCHPSAGVVHTVAPLDDGNPCTIDSCDPVLGVAHTPGPGSSCSDGNRCNGEETCDSAAHCIAGDAPVVDDGDACTTDVCLPASGVEHRPVAPSPASFAIDKTVASNLFETSRYLYTGTCPLQRGIVSTVDPLLVSVIHGKVRDVGGAALGGVKIAIENFGFTRTLADGSFAMVVNAGLPLILKYDRDGFLNAQRQVQGRPLDHAFLPDVILVRADPQTTPVGLNQNSMTVARGTATSDSDGVRQATVLVPPKTTGTMTVAGNVVPLPSTVHLRATEYTTAAGGPQAMPASLPPTSAYTYAVELGLDEAAGASSIDFKDADTGQPKKLPVYVEDFLGFDVGFAVPVGYYDRTEGRWKAVPDGVVLKILSTANGVATFDTTGDGAETAEDNPATVGVTPDERVRLASLYAPGQKLWRARVEHFTPIDMNWPYGPPPNAVAPKMASPAPASPVNGDCTQAGSIIECQSQKLGEQVPIAGTEFTLNYRSDRVPGRKPSPLVIQVTGPNPLPNTITAVRVTVSVAGRQFVQSLAPAPNLVVRFPSPELDWDGTDANGVLLQGLQPAQITISYDYPAQLYSTRAALVASYSFGSPAQGQGATSGVVARASRPKMLVSADQQFTLRLGTWDARGEGLGGFTLSAHHQYDPMARVLYLGDGNVRSAAGAGHVIDSVNLGSLGPQPKGPGLAVAADGSIYMTEYFNWDIGFILKIATDGTSTRVAGGTSQDNWQPNSGPANQITIDPAGLALGPDGALYIVDSYHNRVRRLKDGVLTTVAGSTNPGAHPAPGSTRGDGGPATSAALDAPIGIAVGPDGTLYITDNFSGRVRAVAPNGIIRTIAGSGVSAGTAPDNVPATSVDFSYVYAVAAGPDGSVYFSAPGLLYRVTPDGVLHHFAGTGGAATRAGEGDGGPATSAKVGDIYGIAVAPDGTVLFSDARWHVVRVVNTTGIIGPLAGTGTYDFAGDRGPAIAASMRVPTGLALEPRGDALILDSGNRHVRRVSPAFPAARLTEIVVGSEDGSEAYVFSSAGRHLATRDALTGATKYTFGYDATTHVLNAITNVDGRTLTIADGPDERRVTGFFGQRTTIRLDANGFAREIENPASEKVVLGYQGTSGLLTSFTDPNANVHTFQYEDDGRLQKDSDPLVAGGFKSLTRTGTVADYTVDVSTALGRSTKYQVKTQLGVRQDLVNTAPSGATTSTTITPDSAEAILLADGSRVDRKFSGDPRFGMQSPIEIAQTITTGAFSDGSTTSTTLRSRAATPNATDPLVLNAATDTITQNGKTTTFVYNGTSRTLTRTSPEQRTVVYTLDAKGRTVGARAPGINDTAWTYPPDTGTLTDVTQGTRVVHLARESDSFVRKVTDPNLHDVDVTPDAVGRVLRTVQKASDTPLVSLDIGTAFDLNGNLKTVTPEPGAPSHSLTYNAVNLLGLYTPPALGGVTKTTVYHYNADRQLDLVTLPDNSTITLNYDEVSPAKATGQLRSVVFPNWTGGGNVTSNLTYDAITHRLKTISDPSGVTVQFDYDKSLLTGMTWSGAVSGAVLPKFDPNFRLASYSLNQANQNRLVYTYDDDGLITKAKAFDPSDAAIANAELTIAHDAPPQQKNGLLYGTALGIVTDVHTYDGYGAPLTYRSSAGTTALYNIDYKLTDGTPLRDPSGRLTGKKETVAGVTSDASYAYGYDLAGRLIDANCTGTGCPTGYNGHYDYDLRGNRTDGGASNWDYDAQDRLKRRGTTNYTYNDEGQLTSRTTTGGESWTYVYDALGNLRSATRAGAPATTISYLVDGLGRRVQRTKGSQVQRFLYLDGLRVAAELDGTGAIVSRFVYGSRTNVPDMMIRKEGLSWVPYRIISDHLGSPRLVVNAVTGAVAQKLDYDVWGVVLPSSTNLGFQPFGFAGGLYDVDTGLVHFGRRDYDPAVGRWTAKDAILFGGGQANLYEYVGNDPVSRIDPLGLWYIDINISGGSWVGLTGGLLISEAGVQAYGGGGFVTPGISGMVTFSPENPSPGWNFGLGGAILGGATQAGFDSKGNFFSEYGIGGPLGVSLTAFFVTQPLTLDWTTAQSPDKPDAPVQSSDNQGTQDPVCR